MLWSEEVSNTLGLPRPYWLPDSKFYYKNGKKLLDKKVPMPYQSKPGTEINAPIQLNIEKEKMVVEKDLCAFCGIKINNDENSIRWVIEKLDLSPEKDLVPSDFHPFHIRCMIQARKFCPFLRTLKDENFEISLQKNNLKSAKENFEKYYRIPWDQRKR